MKAWKCLRIARRACRDDAADRAPRDEDAKLRERIITKAA